MAGKWDVYSRQGLDLASSATSLGFSAVKSGTRFGFRIARGITETAVGITAAVVDHTIFGGSAVARPVAGSAVQSTFTLAEQLVLAPIHLSEYLTSTSFIAAYSSINILSVIFPGSSEASFSLVSFIALVRREWSTQTEFLPKKRYRLTHIARAIIAWVALQGVTQEWQEKRWFQYLKELDVKEKSSEHGTPVTRPRRNSRVRVTSDVIWPGERGPQIIAADIGNGASSDTITPRSRNSTFSSISPLTLTPLHPPAPTSPTLSTTSSHLSRNSSYQYSHTPSAYSHYSHTRYWNQSDSQPASPLTSYYSPDATALSLEELKSTLRRLSKMVLAGYGGASLLFFGVTPYDRGSKHGEAREKREEEAKLTSAVDAAEAEAAGDELGSNVLQSQSKYSWWDMLLGKHDQEIFEKSAQSDEEIINLAKKERERERRARMKATAIIGTEHLMPRFWVLTDHGRGQIVLVIRGTMSLNEIAVDLTCEAEYFEPAQTQDLDTDGNDTYFHPQVPGLFMSSARTKSRRNEESQADGDATSKPQYHAHSGMLRMARAMGDIGKPVQLAVLEALYHNPGFDLVLCGHSLGAGVAALLGLMWADPTTCLTVHSSGLPIGRRVYVYCFAPPALIDAKLSQLANKLIVSIVYSHDVVSRLSLGSVRDLRNAALWLCEAEEGKHTSDKNGEETNKDGWSAVTMHARMWKEGRGKKEDSEWFIAVRKTLEANMHAQNMFPPGRVLWAMRDSDLHPSHQRRESKRLRIDKDRLRLFEVLDVEKVFDQIVFAKDMLTAHLPHQYDKVLHDLL